MFQKENPSERRNWKVELELEQCRRVLELKQDNDKEKNRETLIEKSAYLVYIRLNLVYFVLMFWIIIYI